MRYNGSINGVQNNSSPTFASGIWSINDVHENSGITTQLGGSDAFEYLAVGGGGGGGGARGANECGGGGGGGEVISGFGPIRLNTEYQVQIGGHGDFGNGGSGHHPGGNGPPTSFRIPGPQYDAPEFHVEAYGGGGGLTASSSNNQLTTVNGGGGDFESSSQVQAGVAGTNFTGGSGAAEDANDRGGAGGGAGAGGNGSDGTTGGNGGAGGPGVESNITGFPVYYGAGGGGGSNAGSGGAGGTGGGGSGATATPAYPESFGHQSSVRNTGAGGGGAAIWGSNADVSGAEGSKGCLILKYPTKYDLYYDPWGPDGSGSGGVSSGTTPYAPTYGYGACEVKMHPDGIHKIVTFTGGSLTVFWKTSRSLSVRHLPGS